MTPCSYVTALSFAYDAAGRLINETQTVGPVTPLGVGYEYNADKMTRGQNDKQGMVGPPDAAVVALVERLKGQQWEQFRDQHGDWGRDMVLWLGRKLCGAKLRELAKLAGVTTEATVTLAVKRLDDRMRREAELREKVKVAQAKLLNVKT